MAVAGAEGVPCLLQIAKIVYMQLEEITGLFIEEYVYFSEELQEGMEGFVSVSSDASFFSEEQGGVIP